MGRPKKIANTHPVATATPVTGETALMVRKKSEYMKNCIYWIETSDSIERLLGSIESLRSHLTDIELSTKPNGQATGNGQ